MIPADAVMGDVPDAVETTVCPGCKVELPRTDWPGHDARLHASVECHEIAGRVLGFEVEHQAELGHLHQLRIDAYAAQHCGPRTPAISTVFALNGLYMFLEHGSSNSDVRTAHTIMANSGTTWPKLTAPEHVGQLTAADVFGCGVDGNPVERVAEMTVTWAEAVWRAWPDVDRELVRRLTDTLVPRRYYPA